MSKPDEIPQDVWDSASEAFNAAWDAHNEIFNPASNSISDGLAIRFIQASARAIMAERERCALITFVAYQNKTELCTRIIRRIRSGEGLVR